MYVNTLESGHLQELWNYVEGINKNKIAVTKAKDFIDQLLLGKANDQYPGMTWLKFIAGDN